MEYCTRHELPSVCARTRCDDLDIDGEVQIRGRALRLCVSFTYITMKAL